MAISLPRQLLVAWLAAWLAALTATAGAAEAGRYSRGLLWRIDSPGVAPSYLYGTLHADDERVLRLSPAVQRAFSRCRRFALEMLDDEDSIRRYRAAMLAPRPRLAEALGAEDYARVEARLAERGIPARSRPYFKPWAALIVLAQPPEHPGMILDAVLLEKARAQGKSVVQLEGVDEQIEALQGLSEETQLALLRRVSTRQDEIAQAVWPLTRAYLAGDLAGIWQANQEAMGDDPAAAPDNDQFLERLLFRRSERFAGRLEPLLRRGGVFAAFGALHLYGDRGVPALLARRGFRVTRMR